MKVEQYCCKNCFEDEWLKSKAQSNKQEDEHQVCFYCGTPGSPVPLAVFQNDFRNLLKEYMTTEDANGREIAYFAPVPVVNAIQRDWKIFNPSIEPLLLNQFLPNMFAERTEIPFDFAANVVPFHRNAMSTAFNKWRELWSIAPDSDSRLIADLRPGEIDQIGTFANQHASHLKYFVRTIQKGTRLWRARSEYNGTSEWDCEPLPISQMAANPEYPPSRLNRKGEEVLYTAEAERTAIAEIRPGRGNICTTCELETNTDFNVLDLAYPLERLNPFTTADLSWQLDLQRIARNLSGHISKPISRGEDPIVYSKGQYVSKIVRAMKLTGVRFKSSMDSSDGTNLAIFDRSVVDFLNARLVNITDTKISYEPLTAQRPTHKKSH